MSLCFQRLAARGAARQIVRSRGYAQDTALWESQCGRYRIRFARSAWGVAVEPARRYKVLVRDALGWRLLSTHRSWRAALAACQQHRGG
jgi:hypothetical protein